MKNTGNIYNSFEKIMDEKLIECIKKRRNKLHGSLLCLDTRERFKSIVRCII